MDNLSNNQLANFLSTLGENETFVDLNVKLRALLDSVDELYEQLESAFPLPEGFAWGVMEEHKTFGVYSVLQEETQQEEEV